MKKKDFNNRFLSMMMLFSISLSHSVCAQKLIYSTNMHEALNTPCAEEIIVQVGSFRSEKNALRMKMQLENQVKCPIHVNHKGAYYRVIIGPVPPRQTISLEYKPVQRVSVTQQIRPKMLTARHPLSTTKNQKISSFSPAFIAGGSWYIGVGAGVLKPKVSSIMRVNNGSDFDPPNNIDLYSTQSSNHPIMTLQGGKFWKRQDKLLPGYSLGLRYQYLFNRSISGRVTQYSTSEFDNYSYKWGIQTNVVSTYTKLQLIQLGRVIPYLNGGIGAAFNQSGKYTETGNPDIDARDTADFRSSTQAHFTYDLGLGLDFTVNPQIFLSLGYDFQSLGEFSSNRGITSWSSQRLKLDNVYANTALLSLTYLFDHPGSIGPVDNR